MTISYVGGAFGAATATLPANKQAGDIAVVCAFRDGSTTNPAIPAGWTLITNTADGTQCSSSLAWRRLLAGDTTIGTWTNASTVSCAVWRGMRATGTPVGAFAVGAASTSNTLDYPAITPTVADGSSFVARFIAHRSVNQNIELPPTGFVLRTASSGANATAESCVFDTGDGVATAPLRTVTLTGTASGRIAITLELLAEQDGGVCICGHIDEHGGPVGGNEPILCFWNGTRAVFADHNLVMAGRVALSDGTILNDVVTFKNFAQARDVAALIYGKRHLRDNKIVRNAGQIVSIQKNPHVPDEVHNGNQNTPP